MSVDAGEKKIGIRQLTITTMFSIFIALVVFEILTYAYVVPLLSQQKLEMQAMSNRIAALERAVQERDEAPVAAAPAPAVVHASAPAPSGPAAVPAPAR